MTRSRAIAASHRPRRWLTFAALLAFLLQSLAVQTHVHPAAPLAKAAASQAQPQAPAPLKAQDNIDQCRLCHELVHSGVFIAPGVSVLPASLGFALLVLPALPGTQAPPPAAFAWQSRAPPRR